MTKIEPIQVKTIIPFLEMVDRIVIYQIDTLTTENSYEKIFEGSVLDVPWYILDYYLANDPNGEALGVEILNNNPTFILAVAEDKERI